MTSEHDQPSGTNSNLEIAQLLPWRIALTVAVLGTGIAAIADLIH